MKRIGRFFKNLLKNPKTSALGIAGVVGTGLAAAQNPAILAEPATWAAVLTSAGLLAAADSGDNSGN